MDADHPAPGAGLAGETPGPDVRVDRLTGARVVVTDQRQGRPNLPVDGCPFCVGGVESPEPYDVRWFPNRWPALPGRSEVVLYSPRHDAALWELGADGIARVAALWADRTEALGRRDDVAYVLPFENRGQEVGATIDHPHGQIYGFGEVPVAAAHELASRGCSLCEPVAPELVVAEARHASVQWRAWVPAAATWPFELRIAPVQHVPDLPAARAALRGLGEVLGSALARLDRLFASPMPYMLWVHQRPTDGGDWPSAHLHLHIAPLLRAPGTARYVAAGELGSGVFFNPVVPEEAAARLRSI